MVLPRGKFSQLRESCKVKTKEQLQQEQDNISKKKLTDMVCSFLILTKVYYNVCFYKIISAKGNLLI